MSFKAMAFATEQTITKTSPQSHLLLILASYANDNDECYPSIKTMMKKTRLSEKTIRNCLKDLIDFNLIIDTEKLSQFGSKVYQINLNILENSQQKTDEPLSKSTNNPPSKSTTPSKNTRVANLPVPPSKSTSTPPSKSTSTPLVNLPPNPIINHKNNHKSEYAHENSNQTNKPNLQETIEFLKHSGVLPMSDEFIPNEFELNTLISESHAFWGEQLFRNQPLSKNQILGKILTAVKKIGSVQQILDKLTLPQIPITEQPIQPTAYKTISSAERLQMKKQRKAQQGA